MRGPFADARIQRHLNWRASCRSPQLNSAHSRAITVATQSATNQRVCQLRRRKWRELQAITPARPDSLLLLAVTWKEAGARLEAGSTMHLATLTTSLQSRSAPPV